MGIRTCCGRARRGGWTLWAASLGVGVWAFCASSLAAFAVEAARPGEPQNALARWLTPYHREGAYRWLDIADRPYSATFRRLFKYSGRQVLAKYTQTEGETLRGELIAHGLKPNFAYQVKLEGQPTKPGALSGEDLNDPRNWTNKQLGQLGRWWCVDCSYNVSSWGLEGDYHKRHRLLGYLLFDFFVTDANGSARCEFAVAGSYHVLWTTAQYPPSHDDAAPRSFRRAASTAYGYDSSAPPTEVQIYLEQEYDRPRPSDFRLPDGDYHCRLLLTEESFHAYNSGTGDRPGGHWCHCLSDEEVRFVVRR